MKKFFALIFVLLLTAPALQWTVNHLRGNGDNTVRQGFPLPDATMWLDREYYQAVEGWFQESMPLAKLLKRFNNWLDYHLFAASSNPEVRIGIHGWLFTGEPAPLTDDFTTAGYTGHQLFLNLHAVEKMIAATGRRFVFSVVPEKASIYPEYLTPGHSKGKAPTYHALLKASRRHPLASFVALDPALKKAKLRGIPVYRKRSRQWSCEGARVAAAQILEVMNPSRQTTPDPAAAKCPPADNDLYRQLLGEEPQEISTLVGHTSGPHAVDGLSAVVYGDAYLTRLLPFISHAFNGMEVFDSALEPTFDRKVLKPQSDLIVLVNSENGLDQLHLDLESLFGATAGKMQGVVRRSIALAGATALNQCALDISARGLQIRASGPGAFFALPPSPGSSNTVFRMIKLNFAAEHQGRVIIQTSSQDTGQIHKTLSRETHHLIVPLPFMETVAVRVNPSQHPGVYYLENAELLSYYGSHPLPLPSVAEESVEQGDIYSGMDIEAAGKSAAEPILEPSPQPNPAQHPTDVQPELTLTDIREGRIVQRQGKDADIVVSGAYSGVSAPVEAQVVNAETGSVVVPWTVVDGSPENGLFTGILRHVPQGGWYRLNVRSGITPWVVEKGTNRWGVGLLIGCIGQSNMREWFFTGSDHHPSDMIMIHRDGEWIVPSKTGNGALAMGNRLAAALKIPVGLLDYSVNGTGLTPKAEWGKGFWLDTGSDSIYRHLVDGVNAAGGALEYVLWMQGEADAARGTVTREAYREALERFVNAQLRSDIKNGSDRAHLPFLIIPLVKRPTGIDKTCQWIRAAQMDALETIPECHLAALSIDLENRGRQHLAPAAYTTLGVRTAQTILYLLGKVPYHRGPAIAEVTRVTDRTLDVTIDHRGGNDFSPWTQITGFEVVASDRSLPIDSAIRKDSHTIRIELGADLSEAFSVRYLYGAHPETSRPVLDNTDLRLPLEPFSQ